VTGAAVSSRPRVRGLFPFGVDFEYEWAGRESNPHSLTMGPVRVASRFDLCKLRPTTLVESVRRPPVGARWCHAHNEA
jgi:hypothetical protein